ncbi:tRNA-dihydrouridine synthase [Anaeromicrobium sediminis]|uniref:Dihydroorotate dehydrogenase B (NAD(+)), catalytic subunit n=1 Tax=Anaeromicrobium sediminis TaxID=1478221 RepID=A0A267MKK6_9FIRM|nr:4Fe-4S binding protein [Anaeromicrobium sediminis]PAB60066.1 hypothetical protein CCE28_06735 [Anaeromicrobium sediminis]
MNLSVNFMGIELKNPLIIAAGPWTRNGEMMKKAVDAGVGAVVTETIVNEIRANVRPRLVEKEGGMQNIGLYSEFTLEEWENEIGYVKEQGGVVIANILAQTPSEMAYIASRVEKFGADAIELGVASPHGEGIEVLASNPYQLYEITNRVVERVKIPVMVKLSPNVTNVAKLAKVAEKAGASAISAIDTVRSIIGVDVKAGKPLLPTYGGYSGTPIRPIGLAAVASISQAINLQVCGIGGIENYYNILEYMMLGASTIQMGTSIILNGFDHIGKVIYDLEKWMIDNRYENFEEIRGKALTSLKSFDEMKIEPYIAQTEKECVNAHCEKCKIGCIYNAIKKEGKKVIVDTERCTGCGLCVSICSHKNFKLIWKE